MYTCPEIKNTHDYGCVPDPSCLHAVLEETTSCVLPCDVDVYDLCQVLMTENMLQIPSDAYRAIDLYIFLRDKIVQNL